MAELPPVDCSWQLVLPQKLYDRLHQHLFCGDDDEHGAVIAAGLAVTPRGVRLLARELYLAEDGVDYVPGRRGYRMLRADFIAGRIAKCADENLVYLAVHNHGGNDYVAFSADDLRSHERGYPALLDIANGIPVGALVFARNAIAGDIWLPNGGRVVLSKASIIGRSLRELRHCPPTWSLQRDPMYDRHARLFGDAGQAILAGAKVGIIGLGGAGSLIAEYLGRLGVGHFVLADPDRVDVTNLPRLTGASRFDALAWFTNERFPKWLRDLAQRYARSKVALARRNILRANPRAKIEVCFDSVLEPQIAKKFADCDYLFLAADTMRARLLFNAIVHQYLIPGVQVGAKVRVDPETGEILDVYSVVRPVTPESGCLICNGLINSAKLQEESISEEARAQQRYINEPEVVAPSVITLNATAVAHATNDFLFYMTGLRDPEAASSYLRFQPRTQSTWYDEPARSSTCTECSDRTESRLGRGDTRRLPTIERPVGRHGQTVRSDRHPLQQGVQP